MANFMEEEDPNFLTITNPNTGAPLKLRRDFLSPEAQQQYSSMAAPAAPVEPTPVGPAAIFNPANIGEQIGKFGNTLVGMAKASGPGLAPNPLAANVTPTIAEPVVEEAVQAPQGGEFTTVAPVAPVAPKVSAEKSAFDLIKLGNNQLANIETKKALDETKELEAQTELLTNNAKARDERLLAKQKAEEGYLSDISKKQATLDSLEPRDYWANKSTGAKIGAGIAMAMGAYAQAMGAGPNAAMQIINDAIKEDVNLQREKRIKAKESVSGAQSLYDINMKKYGDAEIAAQATYADQLRLSQNKLAVLGSKAKSESQKAEAMKLNGMLDVKRMEIQADMAKKLAERDDQTEQKTIYGITGPQGSKVLAATPKQAEEASKKIGLMKTIAEDVTKLQGIVKEEGANISPIDDESDIAADALRANILSNLAEFKGDKYTKQNEKLYDGMLKNMTSFSLGSGKKEKSITAFKSLLTNETNKYLDSIGSGPSRGATSAQEIFSTVEGTAFKKNDKTAQVK